ncbi:MAG TPA: hypothetical protein DCS01_00840 [Idiomarina abyssalis]|jgi:hypothetical protein|uniref:hypothetical protein n=1 Tax=Idiomarina TaxID=135575 RepID=UPI000C62A73B|nr:MULTISPECIES: hypothetical protein [Idiomarina]MAB22072.1 hypothetical protein [Idiomarina sp.]MBH93311.1 hypothetical protein [Idiomarina sp.]HAS13826.1 hypothetical protein [Idiomarina abyssalis]|tara:strand:+ start:29298 stop:29603 length:306 start_codon:yes stop_codon:yes gene_type:complete
MIKVIINEQERIWDSSQAGWINGTINELQKAGEPTCVRVLIEYGNINLCLSAGACSKSSGGGRPLNTHEAEMVDYWEQLSVESSPLNGGKLIAFLNQIKTR